MQRNYLYMESKNQIDEKLRRELQHLCEEESQVTIHCSILTYTFEELRIWKSTSLIDQNSGGKSVLTHAENIPFHPKWKSCERGEHHFTLFFKGLPKECEMFDLFEDIPEFGGFFKENIQRNSSDVYHITL